MTTPMQSNNTNAPPATPPATAAVGKADGDETGDSNSSRCCGLVCVAFVVLRLIVSVGVVDGGADVNSDVADVDSDPGAWADIVDADCMGAVVARSDVVGVDIIVDNVDVSTVPIVVFVADVGIDVNVGQVVDWGPHPPQAAGQDETFYSANNGAMILKQSIIRTEKQLENNSQSKRRVKRPSSLGIMPVNMLLWRYLQCDKNTSIPPPTHKRTSN
jgi:hypothetical protein